MVKQYIPFNKYGLGQPTFMLYILAISLHFCFPERTVLIYSSGTHFIISLQNVATETPHSKLGCRMFFYQFLFLFFTLSSHGSRESHAGFCFCHFVYLGITVLYCTLSVGTPLLRKSRRTATRRALERVRVIIVQGCHKKQTNIYAGLSQNP